MENTIEEIIPVVLAYCEKTCKNKDLPTPIECGHLQFGYVVDGENNLEAWFLYIGKTDYPLSLYEWTSDAVWISAYRLFGLDKRDALEAERGKSVKLVEAFEEIKAVKLYGTDDTDQGFESSHDAFREVKYIANMALEAYKEGKKDEN